MDTKTDEVVRLEEILNCPLLPHLSGSIMGWTNRKCYSVDAEGRITGLNLRGCGISDASFLGELKSLTALNIGSNNLVDATAVGELRELRALDVRDNEIRDWSFLRRLVELEVLSLSRSHANVEVPLQHLGKISSLHLERCELGDASLLRELRSGFKTSDLIA